MSMKQIIFCDVPNCPNEVDTESSPAQTIQWYDLPVCLVDICEPHRFSISEKDPELTRAILVALERELE